jgi:hypothetical protein
LRQWLNSDAGASAWYSAQHGADAPPTAANVSSGWNPYDTEAGFLSGFSAHFKAALLPTTLTVAKNTATDGGGSETVTDKIFLASNTEVGLANENGVAEGSKLAIFSDNNSRLANPTAQCVGNSNYASSSLNTAQPWYWWLRSPNASYSYNARNVSASGALNNYSAYYGSGGVRPLCNLPSDILVSDLVDSDGAYTILWNQPPTAPDGITTPDALIGGQAANISWGASTDPDGSVTGYILERAANGGNFAEIYRGTNRSFADTIQTGWTTAQYRVRAYDDKNTEGANATSAVLSVIVSNPPVISGEDANLGLQAGVFSQTYTVTNPDAGHVKTLTVVEKISGKEKRAFAATSGAQNTFEVTAGDWLEILNGAGALTITATDNYGMSATRAFSFSKNVSEIEFTLAEPLAADDAVSRVVMSITRQIPPGADFTVEVCNNAYDVAPTWEDITAAVLAGSAFTLSNAAKTDADWGFNVRVKVNRLEALGDCFIKGMGGNFE